MVAQHYRWDFIGLSTDEKPTPATSEKVVDGSTFYCSDNSKLYVFYKDTWYEKTATGGGGGTVDAVKVLTADDYNYPLEGTPDRIALPLLPTGFYRVSDNDVYVQEDSKKKNKGERLYYVTGKNLAGSKFVWVFNGSVAVTSTDKPITVYKGSPTTGELSDKRIITFYSAE